MLGDLTVNLGLLGNIARVGIWDHRPSLRVVLQLVQPEQSISGFAAKPIAGHITYLQYNV